MTLTLTLTLMLMLMMMMMMKDGDHLPLLLDGAEALLELVELTAGGQPALVQQPSDGRDASILHHV